MKNLQDKLEEFKLMGNYSVAVNYGEGTGCDDFGVPQMDRNIMVVGIPVGCLGEVRIMFKGTLENFLKFELKTKPSAISNPPERCEYEDGGWFIWGTESGVERILDKLCHGIWL